MDSPADALRADRDRADIADLLARFDDAILTNDRAAFLALWVHDGRWTIGSHNPNHSAEIVPLDVRGHDALGDALDGFAAINEFFFRATLRPVIAVNGTDARVRVPTLELARRHDGSAYTNVALYLDRVRKVDGTWRFVERRYEYIWIDAHGRLAGDAIPLSADVRQPLWPSPEPAS